MGTFPRYAYLSPEREQVETELTREGVYDLLPAEVDWQKRQQFLDKMGYKLRPRYQPGWKPSWDHTNLNPTYCEDSISLNAFNVIDAIRVRIGQRVSIKRTSKGTKEIDIAQFLTSIYASDSHCVPILEVLQDPFEPQRALVVMPYLLPFNEPEFEAVGEVVDFVYQTLEGLEFLHRNRIAHRDIAPPNVMMDGRALYPKGHHPVRWKFSEDAVYEVSPLSRLDHSVRYLYIDFGISSHFPEGTPPQATGVIGRYKEAPEMSYDVPYDAYKVDVWALGNLFLKEFFEVYYGLDFLQPLVDAMQRTDPTARVSARDAMTMFSSIRTRLNNPLVRWRLRRRTETTSERVVYDTVAVAREGLYHLKRLVA
ncbi:kinase-like domain-containing protein [Ganoderma leucocontextum]|nr:kinase-like domain-containing protein [Ganoderma leucocontextum]